MTGKPYSNYTAAILAGGDSKRFDGKIKPLLPFRNKSILQNQLEVLIPLFPEILLITNSPDKFANHTDFIIHTDIIPHKGPLSGIHTALKKSSHDWVFIVAGDMPFINTETISSQIRDTWEAECDAVIPLVKNNIEPLHGVYHKKVIGKLESLLQSGKESSVKKFLKTINTVYWELNDDVPFMNINTPEELRHYEKSGHYQNRK